jgi:hypothetical protein
MGGFHDANVGRRPDADQEAPALYAGLKSGRDYGLGFCNGPGIVKGSSLNSRVIRSAGVVLLSGVGALAAT